MLALVCVLAVLMVLGAAGVSLATGAKVQALAQGYRAGAYHLAEAGVERALANLKEHLVYPAPGFADFRMENEPLAGGVIEQVSVSRLPGAADTRYEIRSSARYPEAGSLVARERLRVRVRLVPGGLAGYGGPGLKAAGSIYAAENLTVSGGALVAGDGDIRVAGTLSGNTRGIYAGGSVEVGGGLGTGRGDIKAGRRVYLPSGGEKWCGEIWAGEGVACPDGFRSGVAVYENCGADIPGWPWPPFPAVGEDGTWYRQVRLEAAACGRYFARAQDFFEAPEAGVRWNYTAMDTGDAVVITVLGAELVLDGLYVIAGDLDFNAAFEEAHARWQERVRQACADQAVIFAAPGPAMLTIKVGTSATVIARSIHLDTGSESAPAINPGGINGSLGLFGIGGDVTYRGRGEISGRISVLTNGKFICTPAGPLHLDWVAAREIAITRSAVLDFARGPVPPATPVGYRIVAWNAE